MAQTMTASRTTTYQNNYATPSASVSGDMHHSWHPPTHSSHTTSNGINGVSNICPKPADAPNGTTTAKRITHQKSDFYKNGRPQEVIVIDSESPEPPIQSSAKRKRENSISTSTAISAVTKRARKSQNDETAMQSNRAVKTKKSYNVIWFKDDRGVYRAREVIVPKISEVSTTIPATRKNLAFSWPTCFRTSFARTTANLWCLA